MLWSGFKTYIMESLTYHGERSDYDEKFKVFDKYIRAAAIDLQRFIPSYRQGHENAYTGTSIARRGKASVVMLPEEHPVVDGVSIIPNRIGVKTDAKKQEYFALSVPNDGPINVAVEAWIRGEAGERLGVSLDGLPDNDSSTSIIKRSGIWEKHKFNLVGAGKRDAIRVGTSSKQLFFPEGGGGGLLTEYSTAEWSEITVTGDYDDYYWLGETEDARLRRSLNPEIYPWSRVNDLIAGTPPCNSRGYYCWNAGKRYLYLYPSLEDGAVLSLRWTGMKLSFSDTDDTPFTESAADAAALFVQSRMCKIIDGKRLMANSLMDDYREARSTLYSDINLNRRCLP